MRTGGSDIPVIAKIEKPQAAERAEEIVKAVTAGVMIARGDLGIELPIERVPGVQRHLLALAGRYSVPSITATQMLASMVASPRPTRAEVSDVANAIFQGTDAIMLSEETAVGEYPAEAVRVMDRIARETEPELPYGDWVFNRAGSDETDVASSVARAAVGSTYTLGLAAIVVPTRSGRTARLVSAHRPRTPVLAISPRLETVRRLNLLFGVQCVIAEDWTGITALLDDCARLAREAGVAKSGDLIAITAGLPAAGPGHWGELQLVANDKHGTLIAQAAAYPAGVEMNRVASTMRAIEDVVSGRLSSDVAVKAIDDIARSPPAPTWLFTLAAAAGAVALAVIFGVQHFSAAILIFVSAGAGAILRRALGQLSANFLLQPFGVAILAGIIGAMAVRYSPELLIASCRGLSVHGPGAWPTFS